MSPPLPRLPIDDCLPELLSALRSTSCAVLQAPPGAGKTTRVAPALLLHDLAGEGKILVLQPRRVAARATAARIAAEQGWRLGDEVGFQVRFESKIGPRTRIELITEGILLQRLQRNPFLEGVSIVVFDEFHERSLTSDLSLAMTRQVQQAVRSDLKLLVMSATLAAEPISKYLDSSPIVRSEGRIFPVDVQYAPTLDRQPLPDAVSLAVSRVKEDRGDILVFLPGLGEIRQVGKRLQTWSAEHGVRLLELYGDLPGAQQDEVLQPSPERKLILSTNVAETSLTIPGVTTVIDSGLARIARYDEQTGLDKLELSPISKASANQRAGRAGRTGPGTCIRLWPEASQRLRSEFDEPELKRVDLAGAVLTVLNWIEPDLQQFPWYESPSSLTLQRAVHLLERLEAVEDGQITPLGKTLAALPVHPRLGRLLLEGAKYGIAEDAATAAALLSERDVFLRANYRPGDRRTPSHRSHNDIADRIAALDAFAERGTTDSDVGTINRSAAKQALRAGEQLQRMVQDQNISKSARNIDRDEALGRALLAAFPDRLARLREPGSRRALMVGGRGVKLADQSAVTGEELFLAIDVEASTGEATARLAAGVERDWLPRELLSDETSVSFDETQQRVVSQKIIRWDDLVLDSRQAALPSAEEVAAVLAPAAAANWDKAFPTDNENLNEFVTRVRCLNEWNPQLGLPMLDETTLKNLLPELCLGCKSLADVRRAPWLQMAKSLFIYQQLQQVDREAPERIGVPSGSQIAIQYAVGQPPVLAVRIQEVFGLMETPRIAGGRVPLLMHLLAPNMRVAQVTADLKSFWASSYALVRKDLRNRYPKHSWPENPYEALPQKRPTRKA